MVKCKLCELEYSCCCLSPSHLSPLSYLGRVNLTEVYLAGVGEALEEHSRGEPKGIKAHFRMDESGLLQLVNVSGWS